MLNSLRQTVATPRKWPGRALPSRLADSFSTSTQVWKPSGIHLVDGRDEEEVDAGRFRDAQCRAPRRADSARNPLPAPNWAGLTKMLATTTSFSRAGRLEERDVAGMEGAHCGHEPDALARESGARLVDSAERLHGVLAPSSEASVSASAR